MNKSIDQLLANLSKAINTKITTIDARKRISKDLNAVYNRTVRGEYKISGIIENVFDVPDKSKQFYGHLLTYANIGKAWGHIFDFIQVNKYLEVTDICPGYAPKIELGLYYSDFAGKVNVVDMDRRAITTLSKFVNLFNVQFSVKPCVSNIFSTKNKFDFVVGNHAIDDLVLNYFATKNNVSMVRLYEEEGAFVKMWNEILGNKDKNINEVVLALASVLRNITKDGGLLCLSHYKSYMERMLGLNQGYYFSKKVFISLKKNLCGNGFMELKLPVNVFGAKDSYFSPSNIVVLIKNGHKN